MPVALFLHKKSLASKAIVYSLLDSINGSRNLERVVCFSFVRPFFSI